MRSDSLVQEEHMTVWIAMLRGVNLGKRRMKMDALRELFGLAGCSDVQTYVQSGNVVFRSAEKNAARLGERLEAAIEEQFGFAAPVVLRSTAEMRRVVELNPFPAQVLVEPGKVQVMFLYEDPGEAKRKLVRAMNVAPEELRVEGAEIFIYYPVGQGLSKLKWGPIEKALGTSGTARNWTTVCTLLEMGDALEG